MLPRRTLAISRSACSNADMHQAVHELQGQAGTYPNDLFTKTARQDFFGPDGLSAEPEQVSAEFYHRISVEEPLSSGSSL